MNDTASMLNSQLASALSTDAQYFEETISPNTIRTSLAEADPSNPTYTHSLLRAMKWLLASISKGRDVSDFFPLVVKLVGAASLEVRKMVYMYLVHYADYDATTRELGLLSINSFQRGMADAEQLIRALALRVLTSIRIPDILQIQILGVQKSLKDKSPYVRKCAANAIAKLSPRCDRDQQEILLEMLKDLLDEDQATMVLTSAMVTFAELCPSRLELLHGSYRKFCHLLTDMDEWGQVLIIETFMRYCRKFFREPSGWKGGTAEVIDRERRVRRTVKGIENNTDPTTISTKADAALSAGVELPKRTGGPRIIKRRIVKKGFYSDEEDESTEEEVIAEEVVGPANETTENNPFGLSSFADEDLNPDHRLLLESAMSLLRSRNAGVVMSVCSLQYYCGVSSIQVRAAMGRALVRIHRDSREIQYVVLSSIRSLAKECPSAFTPFLQDFFVTAMDPPFTRLIKLDILTTLALEPAAIQSVLKELRSYVKDPDQDFVCASVRAVSRVAELARIVYDRHGQSTGNSLKDRDDANKIALNCLFGLITLSQTSEKAKIVGESVISIQRIMQMLLSSDENLNDSNNVLRRVFNRVLLLVINSLSGLVKNNAIVEDDGEESQEESALERIGVNLPDEAMAASLWLISELLSLQHDTKVGLKDILTESLISDIRHEVLRLLTASFLDLGPLEKEQAVHTAGKFMVSADTGVQVLPEERALAESILAMARIDPNVDVRDRARFESAFLRSSIGLRYDSEFLDDIPALSKTLQREHARLVYLSTKPESSSLPVEEELSCDTVSGSFRFGTLSSLVGHRARGAYHFLPPWAEKDSPDSLREERVKVAPTNGNYPESPGGFYGDGSASESSTDSGESDSDSSSDESSSESSSDSSPANRMASNNNRRQFMPQVNRSNAVTNIALNGDEYKDNRENESSSGSDDESSSDSESSSSEDEISPQDGTLLIETTSNGEKKSSGSLKGTSLSDFQGMTIASPPKVKGGEASAWVTLVRPDLASGLSVKVRFLRHERRKEQLQSMGQEDKVGVVACQVRFENCRDSGPFRQVRLIQRSVSGRSIQPSKVLLPPPLDIGVRECTDCPLLLEFSQLSDRDGVLSCKLEVRQTSGGIPVEVKPGLADVLEACSVNNEASFDRAMARLQGFQRVETPLSSFDGDFSKVFAAASLSYLEGSTNPFRFMGRLPVSKDIVYVTISPETKRLVVCSDNALAVNPLLQSIKSGLV